MAVLQIVDLTLAHQGQRAGIQIEILQLLRAPPSPSSDSPCPIQIVEPEFQIAGFVINLLPGDALVTRCIFTLQARNLTKRFNAFCAGRRGIHLREFESQQIVARITRMSCETSGIARVGWPSRR